MRLLIYSDLHLDQRGFKPHLADGTRADANVDVVVLAGDIDEGVRGILWAREAFENKQVIYVAGNHEFYGKHWGHHLDDMRDTALKHDIDFLVADGIDLGGVRFLGCTLWADFALYGEDKQKFSFYQAKARMNDHQEIKVSRTPVMYWVTDKVLIPEITMARHRGSVDWLAGKLTKGDPARTVEVTHHAPHAISVPAQFQGDALTPAYASDLTRLLGSDKCAIWIHGHMHSSSDYEVDGTRIVCNPLGYRTKNGGLENTSFKVDGVWTL